MKYIMALDQGTTSSRCLLFDQQGQQAAAAQREFRQVYPKAGLVEHDPEEIWTSQLGVAAEALELAGATPEDVAAIGVTNQRETTIVWDKRTGKCVYNAIVWQCRRTAAMCDALRREGWEEKIAKKTGLVLDPYFSATKLKWILDNVPQAREKAQRGDLLFGTVDCYLIWRLTGGKAHVTDYSNASRTMLYNIYDLEWDQDICRELDIPMNMLPQVMPSSAFYGLTDPKLFGGSIPICGAAGDQQAALFGQACFEKGQAKSTYGTGGFLLMNTGTAVNSKKGLISTIAWGIDGRVDYALEGSVFVAGAAVQWLRDELRLVDSAQETEYWAEQVEDTLGVYVVPAFVGLGAPHWDAYARGGVFGLTRGANKAHLIRAVLESIAFQMRDVARAMEEDAGVPLSSLRVDGGASANNFLMQFQADILGRPVARPRLRETTALGAAYLAGLGSGFWSGKEELVQKWEIEREFTPQMDREQRENRCKAWSKAVDRCKGWAE